MSTNGATVHDREPTFTELVYDHYAWWTDLRAPPSTPEVDARYHETLDRFEQQHGHIVRSFWCSQFESATILCEKAQAFPRKPKLTFFRESDWATRDYPQIAVQLHRCDILAVRANTVLTGVRQRICLQLVAASATHLLSLVEAATAQPSVPKADIETALANETAALDKAEAYYHEAANGQAQIIYFAGMAVVAIGVVLVASLVLNGNGWHAGVAALGAGAAGAVVSVVQRINSGDFQLDYDVGRPYAFFLGGLRPLIGAAFAVVISFAFTAGVLHLPLATNDPDHRHLALVVVAFLAGFSERWAQDTLATAIPVAAKPAPPAPKQQAPPPPNQP